MTDDTLIDFFLDAEGVVVGLEQITHSILDRLPNLKIIAKYGVGLDNIDLEACKERNIAVGWTGGVNKRSVAEMSLGFMLALCRNLYSTSNQLKGLVWNKDGGTQLSGKTIGIIGCGNIGKELIQLLTPFQCNIIINDIIEQDEFAALHSVKSVTKEELFLTSDFISIHTPLTSETYNLFNLNVFRKMKQNSILINTSRGGIVNEQDLKYALTHKMIAGAALDVYEVEPPIDMEFLAIPNLICTPHTGGNSYEAVVAMGLSAIAHLVNHRNNK
jgi:D-3-phosphoglycerate dehydrogenase